MCLSEKMCFLHFCTNPTHGQQPFWWIVFVTEAMEEMRRGDERVREETKEAISTLSLSSIRLFHS
jgi:hypothetical protein